MWRFLAGALAAMLLMGAGLVLWNSQATSEQSVTDPPPVPLAVIAEPLPDTVPSASPKTREERRFDRSTRTATARSHATSIWRSGARPMPGWTPTATASSISTNGRRRPRASSVERTPINPER